MTDRGRQFESGTLVRALAGLAATGLAVDPGEYAVGAGVVAFDPFYALVALFGSLALPSMGRLLRGSTDG